MIELVQENNNLIGSKNDIESLACKDHARILVASDSHNHFDILLDIINRFGPTCDAFAFCGDGFGDIVNILNLAKEDDDLRKNIPPVVAFVAGNCDPSIYPISIKEQFHAPSKQVLTVNGQKILIVHGHRESVDYSFNNLYFKMKSLECKTALYGHTHIAAENYIDDFKFINPGSCSNPRGGQPQTFAILTVEKKFIDTAFIMINNDEDDPFKIWKPN